VQARLAEPRLQGSGALTIFHYFRVLWDGPAWRTVGGQEAQSTRKPFVEPCEPTACLRIVEADARRRDLRKNSNRMPVGSTTAWIIPMAAGPYVIGEPGDSMALFVAGGL
jgi:hypothetical protein